jgi:hypothetical protein
MIMFSDFGCTILKRDKRHFIQYDNGQSSGGQLVENETTITEMDKAKKSEQDAYEGILAAESRTNPRKVTP